MRQAVWLLGILLIACAKGDEVQLQVTQAPPAAVEFGEPFELALKWRWPGDARADSFSTTAFAPFEVEVLGERREEVAEVVEVRRRLRLRAFQEGRQQLPLAFGAVLADGRRIDATPPSLAVEVRSSLQDHSDRRPERPVPLPQTEAQKLVEWHYLAALSMALVYALFALRARLGLRRAAESGSPSPWIRFEALLGMPRDSRGEQLALAQAIRAAARELVSGEAWSGTELAERLTREYALPPLERQSLRQLIDATEEACFAGVEEPPLSGDALLDLYAEVLRAITVPKQREDLE